MKKILIFLLLFSALLFPEASNQDYILEEDKLYEEYTPPSKICYRFDKEDFHQTLEIPRDIIISTIDRDELTYVDLILDAPKKIPHVLDFHVV